MTSYAQASDLYKYGMPRGVLGLSSRLVDVYSSVTSTLTLNGHGFATGDALIFRATEGGALAAPLVFGTTYYAVYVNDAQFSLSSTADGLTPVVLTSVGVSMLVAVALPIDDVLEFYARWIDHFMPAHLVPFTSPVPVVVVALNAELAAKKLMNIAGHESGTIDAFEISAKAMLERFAKGLPLRDANATGPANLTATATLVVTGTDPRGWGSGILPGGRNCPPGGWGGGAL